MSGTKLGKNVHKARPGRRWRCGFRGGLLRSVFVLALLTVGSSSASTAAGASELASPAGGETPGPTWLCQPGQAADPCSSSLAVTALTASGAPEPATWPRSALASKFDCFYVYPTESLADTGNTTLAVTKVEAITADEQAAPLSRVCDVWAPAYRSQTFPSVLKGLDGDEAVMASTFNVAYNSVLPAWQYFLAHTQGKPVVLVGDSQGSAILIHLISVAVDHEPSVLRRLLVAVLVGGNLQVPSGKTVGATFTKVPLCTSGTESGCAIAFSSFPSQPPADSLFGRPGQGVSLQSGQTAKAGQQVACVNPAALAGGTADLSPYYLQITQVPAIPGISYGLKQALPTPWVTYPKLYSARCEHGGGASWLQVTNLAGGSHARPVLNDKSVTFDGDVFGPAWGYHGLEYGLTLGNLLKDIAGEEAAWQGRH